MQDGYLRPFDPIDVLSRGQLEAVHGTSVAILETCGANVRHGGALSLLKEAGCLVDFETQMARIPAGLAEECLRLTPSSYVIRARDAANDVQVGGDRVHFMQGMGMRYVDPDTWELRPATLQEHAEAQIVGDALPNVHLMDGVFAYTDLAGVPGIMQQLEGLASGFRHSSKAQHYGYMKDSDRFAIRMAQALDVTLETEVDVAPAVAFGEDAVNTIWRFAELGWGIEACPGGNAGVTAPASLAGTAAQHWAATMAFIVLAQLIRRGAPVGMQLAGWVVHTKWAIPITAAPEAWYVGAVTNQLCRRWNIPITTPTGFCGQAKMFDYQAAAEKALGVVSTVLSGSNLHVLQGSHGEELGFSNILQVMDDDIAGAIGRFLQGTEVNDETLALEVVRQIGTAPASFMNTAHTRKYWAKDRFAPSAADWDTHVEWLRSGKKDIVTRARERAEAIIAEHEPPSLTAEQERAVSEILGEAREYYRATGDIRVDEWNSYVSALDTAGLL
ncbi:MAG TPA: trimethylamine methyltransferase family protein [Thermoleophilia bacterium]|nr:trimethylamine methyltransferase family protein [Thermoleophilia bacterium]